MNELYSLMEPVAPFPEVAKKAPASKQKGYCFASGTIDTQTKIENRLVKNHNQGDEDCYLIRAQGQ